MFLFTLGSSPHEILDVAFKNYLLKIYTCQAVVTVLFANKMCQEQTFVQFFKHKRFSVFLVKMAVLEI